MKEAIIIQARVGKDSRLPYKVLLPLGGRPAIYRMLDNLVDLNIPIIVAIPETDNTLEEVLKSYSYNNHPLIHIFKGSEDNVIQRVIDAAEYYEVESIIDLTADCPVIRAEMIRDCLKEYRLKTTMQADENFDKTVYVSNVFPTRSVPDGWDVQVYSLDSLRAARKYIKDEKHYSHCGWNVYDKSTSRSSNPFPVEKPNWIFTLDTIEDWKFLDALYWRFCSKDIKVYSPEFFIEMVELDSNLMQLQKACQKIRRKVAGEG